MLNSKKAFRSRKILAFAGLMAVAGVLVVRVIFAAGPIAAFEAEVGVPTGGAEVKPLTGASGGSVLAFTTPAATAGCPALPAHPDASCTGWRHTGVTLTKVPAQATSGTGWSWDGSYVNVTADNAVISGLDISGGVDYKSKRNVTVKNTWVRGNTTINNDYLVKMTGTDGSLIDTEIGGLVSGTSFLNVTGLYIGGGSLLRVNIHHVGDGVGADPYYDISMVDSFIHDLAFGSDLGGEPHTDGVQAQADVPTANKMTFNHNTVQGGNDAGLFFQGGGAITVTNNYFYPSNRGSDGVTSFGLAIGGSSIIGPVIITNNLCEHGFLPTCISNNALAGRSTQSGNTYSDGTSAD